MESENWCVGIYIATWAACIDHDHFVSLYLTARGSITTSTWLLSSLNKDAVVWKSSKREREMSSSAVTIRWRQSLQDDVSPIVDAITISSNAEDRTICTEMEGYIVEFHWNEIMPPSTVDLVIDGGLWQVKACSLQEYMSVQIRSLSVYNASFLSRDTFDRLRFCTRLTNAWQTFVHSLFRRRIRRTLFVARKFRYVMRRDIIIGIELMVSISANSVNTLYRISSHFKPHKNLWFACYLPILLPEFYNASSLIPSHLLSNIAPRIFTICTAACPWISFVIFIVDCASVWVVAERHVPMWECSARPSVDLSDWQRADAVAAMRCDRIVKAACICAVQSLQCDHVECRIQINTNCVKTRRFTANFTTADCNIWLRSHRSASDNGINGRVKGYGHKASPVPRGWRPVSDNSIKIQRDPFLWRNLWGWTGRVTSLLPEAVPDQ